MNDLKGAKYVLEEKYCLLKDLNASINSKEAETKKYKGQVHGMKVFLEHMKYALSREMQISQSKSMELDALCKEEYNESIVMVHRAELEKQSVPQMKKKTTKVSRIKKKLQGLL